jgi:DNA polymerase I-like protein with 3'-5' exonuclease and polymerase domains
MKRKNNLLYQPPSEWLPPEKFPNLKDAKLISVDLETQDPNLIKMGPGWARNDGRIVGIAVSNGDRSWYFPFGHGGGYNLSESIVKKWAKEILENPNITKIFHNAPYDVGWLRWWGINVKGTIYDTMIAAPLVDENRFSYTLDSLSRDFLGERKNEKLLREVAEEWGLDPKADMWKLPAQYVGEYAEQDAHLTFKLWEYLEVEMNQQDIWSIFELETKLQPTLIDMRWKGVRVDIERADALKEELKEKEDILLKEIQVLSGLNVEIWAAASVAKAFDKLKIKYNRTSTGKPSFTKNSLLNAAKKHPLPKLIVDCREVNKAHTTFIDTILKHNYKGRIHAEIHQLRSQMGGTVTGRMSYANPNLQQVPARNKDLGPRIRSLFMPEEGCKWVSFDYNQQEPRLVVHYGVKTNSQGVEDFVDKYKKNTDFHAMVATIAKIDRSVAKTINLGLFYGMGKGKLMDELGIEWDEATHLLNEYHNKVPFLKQLSTYASQKAAKTGVIRTLLGRRCRFHLWEPEMFGVYKPLPEQQAKDEHGPQIKRAFTYKALNRLIQGSGSDMTKQAMVALADEKIYPMLQIHDELAISIEQDKIKEKTRQIKKIMEECVKLEVPNKVDVAIGNNWGTCK